MTRVTVVTVFSTLILRTMYLLAGRGRKHGRKEVRRVGEFCVTSVTTVTALEKHGDFAHLGDPRVTQRPVEVTMRRYPFRASHWSSAFTRPARTRGRTDLGAVGRRAQSGAVRYSSIAYPSTKRRSPERGRRGEVLDQNRQT
jgi:hypothetical protein